MSDIRNHHFVVRWYQERLPSNGREPKSCHRIRAATLGLALVSILPIPSLSQHAIPAGRIVRGTLSFDGHATLGDFVGSTDSVTGEMTGGPDAAAVRGWVEGRVASLTSGNGRRDRDMRSSMEVGTYPVMRFDLDSATATTATASDSLVVMLHGRLTVHGVTRDVALPGRVWSSGDTVRVRSDFPLNLKDYHIGGLSKMLGVLKMHEGIEVHVALVFGRPAVP